MQNTQFVTDAEVQQYIQDSVGDLYDLIIESAGPDHFRKELTFDTIAGTSDYGLNDRLGASGPFETAAIALPVYKLIRVSVQFDGKYRTVRPYQPADGDALVDSTSWEGPRGVFYEYFHRFEASSSFPVLRFMPVPTGVFSVQVHYIPSPTDLSGSSGGIGSVTLNSFAGWDEWVVCDAAAKCLEKEESFAHADRLLARREKAGERIRWHAATMNQYSAGHVRDADLYDHDGWLEWDR